MIASTAKKSRSCELKRALIIKEELQMDGGAPTRKRPEKKVEGPRRRNYVLVN